jgi:hypothetical protein
MGLQIPCFANKMECTPRGGQAAAARATSSASSTLLSSSGACRDRAGEPALGHLEARPSLSEYVFGNDTSDAVAKHFWPHTESAHGGRRSDQRVCRWNEPTTAIATSGRIGMCQIGEWRVMSDATLTKKACRNLRYLKYEVADPDHGSIMATVLFLCPSTGYRVQGWFADNGSEDSGEMYEVVTCLACRQIHMVNPRTGKVLGADEE